MQIFELFEFLITGISVYFSNLSECEATEVLVNADIASFLSSVVKHLSEKLSDKHWDFIMCSLASWVQVCIYILF